MRLHAPGAALVYESTPLAPLLEHQVLIEVSACGVCRTDLHLVDGELPQAVYPVTPGHEIVGRVVDAGRGVTAFRAGDRVGVPWLAQTCGSCRYCERGQENLCERARFTGCTVDGGYAQHAIADARYCLALPDRYSDAQATPLLCAGLIGYRAYRAAGEGVNLGLYGFGAAAHLLAQVARAQGRRVFALTRPGDVDSQQFARELGAAWAGGSDERPPEPLDAAIIFAAVGLLVPAALAAFPYHLLWGERSLCSVANLTRADAHEFMRVADQVDLHPNVELFPLEGANEALHRLRGGELRGAAVLTA
jgi:propanol-preferring alcohol dehydrogenase